MSPEPKERTKSPDRTGGPPVARWILAEWVTVIAVLVGIGVMPLLTGPVAVDTRPFWVPPLAAGALALCAGLFLGRTRKAPDPADEPVVVGPWQVWVRMPSGTTGQSSKQPAVNQAGGVKSESDRPALIHPQADASATTGLAAAGSPQIAPPHLLIALGLLLLLPGLIALITQSDGRDREEI